MNNPDDLPVDVKDQQDWLTSHKASTGASWSELARHSGIPSGTLSQFGVGSYKGDNERVARDVFRFRQHLATQAEIDVEAPDIPGYFPTPTSKQIISLLSWAQRGRITAIAMGPGTGKTKAIQHYQDSVSNVWVMTASPSTSTLSHMQREVLAALGERELIGAASNLSRRICSKLQHSKGLLVFDEAQHLHLRTVEEIRAWHDKTAIGIALVGNQTVISRLEGGGRSAAYAQLFSRIGMRMERNLPLPDDARALAEAWGLEDGPMTNFVMRQAMFPGGLRTVTMMLELATMIARSERQELSLKNLQDAWAQLVARPIAA
jgi:DNA transposition AAA+ family ATPase